MIRVEREKDGIRVIRDGVVSDVVEEIAFAVASATIDAYKEEGSARVAQAIFFDIIITAATIVRVKSGFDVMDRDMLPISLAVLYNLKGEKFKKSDSVSDFARMFAEKMADDGMEDNLPWLF